MDFRERELRKVKFKVNFVDMHNNGGICRLLDFDLCLVVGDSGIEKG